MLIAGNWKMFKGPAETRAFLEAFQPPEGVDVVLCPPFASLAVAVESGAQVYAQNVHWEPQGAYTGEISAPMLRELGVAGALVGHSERRQLFGETDEMVARRARTALDEGLGVIACVGETLEQRESGDTELVLKIQVEALAFAAGGHENLVIAYEPVWAIGTGRTATPGAGGGRAPVHQGRARRPGPLRRLGQAGERGRAPRPALDRRRARRRRLARARLLRSDLPGRVDLVTLVVLDGWGCAPPGPGNAVELAGTPVFDRLWARVPAHDARGVRRGGRPAARADGQLRGRPSDDRVRPDSLPGSAAGERRDPRRLPPRERGAHRRLRAREGARRRRPPARARLQGRRPLPPRPPAGAARARAPAGDGGAHLDPRVHRRPGRLAACRRLGSGRAAAGTARDRDRPVRRDGPRPALGADAEGLRRDHARPRHTLP